VVDTLRPVQSVPLQARWNFDLHCHDPGSFRVRATPPRHGCEHAGHLLDLPLSPGTPLHSNCGGFDRDGCIYPFRDSLKRAPEVHRLLDNIGRLDELLSQLAYREGLEHSTTLPEIKTAKQHAIQLKGVKNPILASANANYVGNDIDLGKPRLTLITGPNSGGKTAFCKTLAQSQLLAQAGAFVVAEDATVTIADRIFHQAPEISQLADGEGRFGTELRRTKAIFMASTAQSLVIMDELSEGTTHEEKIEISMNILDGFAKKGSSTLLITHNHALVDQYVDRPEALTRQVEFAGGKPTFRLISGISRVSHADQVAARIGFTKADIDRHLEEEKNRPNPENPGHPNQQRNRFGLWVPKVRNSPC